MIIVNTKAIRDPSLYGLPTVFHKIPPVENNFLFSLYKVTTAGKFALCL